MLTAASASIASTAISSSSSRAGEEEEAFSMFSGSSNTGEAGRGEETDIVEEAPGEAERAEQYGSVGDDARLVFCATAAR